ncbi:hypothetical protein EV182_002685 [Spiromyces aspiralis]|uniref:Uncharacterized protein n=1 Tax=Spiromyces aspiralis TaxID=68401 RepID=A0ACC1HV53_9FUNG|nr:hypothetical protein EV182_002685 [Spiromyces aspiralis]
MSRVAREIVAKLDAATPLQSYVSKPKTLFEVLNVQRSNGVGSRVQQTRWAEKGFDGCYWMVTNVRYKNIKGVS